jgi:DNA-binding MarR family transcriptional regulator
MKKKELEDSDIPLGRHLTVLTKHYVGALTKRLEDIGLKRHYTLLLTIGSAEEPLIQSDICNALHIDKASMVRNIDYLVKKGLVTRVRGKDDRREYFIEITSKGEKIMERILESVAELNSVAFRGVPVSAQKEFYNMLHHMTLNLREEPSHSVVLNYKNLGNKKNKKK